MNKNTKVVNIYPTMPITGINPPIRSVVRHVTKSIKEIRTCLMSRAIVEEVLSDGSTVRLNIGNYDKVLDCYTKSNNTETVANTTETKKSVETKTEKTVESKTEEKTPWQIAYEKALEGKDLGSMTRKQRRSAEAAARAEADAAVAEPVVETEDDIETLESVEITEESTTEETVEVEEEVVTNDAEDISSVIE